MSIEDCLKVTDDQQIGITELRTRNVEELTKDIELMVNWWKKQPHLPEYHGDDELLGRLIHFNKFSLERTKAKIDYFYASPHLYPLFFKNRDPLDPAIQQSRKAAIYVPLPRLTESYGRITCVKRLDTDTPFIATDMFQVMLMTADLRLVNDRSLNDYLIIDLSNYRLSDVKQFNPVECKQAFDVIQKGYADQLAGIHIVNAPSYTITIINLLKTLLKEKIVSRIYVHENFEQLQEHFSKKILPKEYGGDEKSLVELQDNWTNLLVSKRDFYLNKRIRSSNEKLRTGPPLENDVLGIQGSFKHISVD